MNEVIDLINQYNPQGLAPQITANMAESLVLQTKQVEDNDIPIGRSKIGGMPDLPEYVVWPVWKNKPLSFIAQINLVDIPKFDFLNFLPEAGILSFFYYSMQGNFGNDPGDKGSWRVIHSRDGDLERRTPPELLSIYEIYKSCKIKFKRSITIPDLDFRNIDFKYGLPTSGDDFANYYELKQEVSKLLEMGMEKNRMFGHPDQIQGDMQEECELRSQGIARGENSGSKNPQKRILKTRDQEWELLLQLDSIEDAQMMWGDAGRLYFWIPRKELEKLNFDAVWMIMQFH